MVTFKIVQCHLDLTDIFNFWRSGTLVLRADRQGFLLCETALHSQEVIDHGVAAKTVVHALIASWVDYCSSVFRQINEACLQALQSVLNAAALLVMQKQKYNHIMAAPSTTLLLQTWIHCRWNLCLRWFLNSETVDYMHFYSRYI